MPDDFVGVAPDGSGKKIDATSETTPVGSVERQRVSVASVGGNNVLAIDAAGKIGVNNFPATQPVSVAAGQEADGHSATIGTTTDASSANTLVGILKAIKTFFGGGLPAALTGAGNLKVALQESNATQAITAAALPLPSGAATDANLSALMGTVSDQPGVYTVLDRLKRIADTNSKTVASEKTLQLVLAALQSRPKPAASGTLLHRS